MPRVKVSLSIRFATPPSIGAGGVSGTVSDKSVTRNACGEFIIPASQVKGKLRHACEQLLRAQDVQLCRPPQPDAMCPHDEAITKPPCLLCEIFGSPGYPCLLRFHDLTVKNPDLLPQETLRQMVSLNRHRRTAQDQRLFLVETAPHIRDLLFENTEAITGQVRKGSHMQILLAGMKMLFAWGGATSRGLGWSDMEGVIVGAWLNEEPVTFDVEEVKKALCQSSE